MESSLIFNKLTEQIVDDYIHVEEYQDKYYLKKEIKNIFPDLTDDVIYKAIEDANLKVKPPKKKNEFLKALVNIITNKRN